MRKFLADSIKAVKALLSWLFLLAISSCSTPRFGSQANSTPQMPNFQPGLTGIHKIQHVVIIMQENRSFDSYLGTFPGADGIPMRNGVPIVCVPDPHSGQCVKPYHDPQDRNLGRPHGQVNATNDIDGGKMDGFIKEVEAAICRWKFFC